MSGPAPAPDSASLERSLKPRLTSWVWTCWTIRLMATYNMDNRPGEISRSATEVKDQVKESKMTF